MSISTTSHRANQSLNISNSYKITFNNKYQTVFGNNSNKLMNTSIIPAGKPPTTGIMGVSASTERVQLANQIHDSMMMNKHFSCSVSCPLLRDDYRDEFLQEILELTQRITAIGSDEAEWANHMLHRQLCKTHSSLIAQAKVRGFVAYWDIITTSMSQLRIEKITSMYARLLIGYKRIPDSSWRIPFLEEHLRACDHLTIVEHDSDFGYFYSHSLVRTVEEYAGILDKLFEYIDIHGEKSFSKQGFEEYLETHNSINDGFL